MSGTIHLFPQKLRIYALKIDNKICQCPFTQKLLLAPFTIQGKENLIKLKTLISEQVPEYKKAKIVKLKEF